MSGEGPVNITYEMRFENGEIERVSVDLDPANLALMRPLPDAPPAWASLDQVGCPNCPLREKELTWCPVAAQLAELVDRFSEHHSYEDVDLTVTTQERTVIAKTTLQAALGGLTGIYMVTSGCPTLNKLRPMVRFHLPLATEAETVYRAASMYLLGQYLLKQKGLEPDWNLRGLNEIYLEVHEVNRHIAESFRSATKRDAHANALVRLDLFTMEVAFSIQETMGDFEYLFRGSHLPTDAGVK